MNVKVTSHKKEVLEELEKSIRTGLEACGLQAEGYAKEEITRQKAIDTGRLRNSISHAVTDEKVVIGTNVEYASYVELGTSRMKARPYLRPAAGNHSSEYAEILKSYLKG